MHVIDQLNKKHNLNYLNLNKTSNQGNVMVSL